MISTAILNIPLGEVLNLWKDFTEAYHGVHGYGGHVAEIYAYRLCRDDPTRRLDGKCVMKEKSNQEAYDDAKLALIVLLQLFAKNMQAFIMVNGKTLAKWHEGNEPFDHRVHVEILPKGDE